MPKYDHNYLEEDNEFYPAPSFPMTLKMKDEFKAFLFDCSKEELVEHVHQFLSLDGKGYPFGKKGDEISQYVRMASIVDVYHFRKTK